MRQPVVHSTNRTPGPSTTEPVWNECTKPLAPSFAVGRTGQSGYGAGQEVMRWKVGAKGPPASGVTDRGLRLHLPVERPVHHVELLLARQLDEVDGVARDADRELRVLLRVLHRVEQRLAVQHVDVNVEALLGEV